jgi:hypothetical protein
LLVDFLIRYCRVELVSRRSCALPPSLEAFED